MSPAPLRSDPAVRLQATLPSLPSTDASGNRKYATSWLAQFWVLLGRTAKLKFRDPMSFATILSGVIVVSLLEGSIYYDMPVGDWQNRIGGISMFISFMAFMAFDVLMLWPKERQVYLRDQRAGMYCSSSFYTARTLAEVPTHMLTGILGGIITYYVSRPPFASAWAASDASPLPCLRCTGSRAAC